jgi:hypothetical protein
MWGVNALVKIFFALRDFVACRALVGDLPSSSSSTFPDGIGCHAQWASSLPAASVIDGAEE